MINMFNSELKVISSSLSTREYVKAIGLAERTRKRFNHIYATFPKGYELDFLQASAIAKLETGRVIVPDQDHIDELTRAAELYENCLELKRDFSAGHMGLGLTYRALAMASANYFARSSETTKMINRFTESAIFSLQIAKKLNTRYTAMADKNLDDLIACRSRLRMI
jgi:hypothetical protein